MIDWTKEELVASIAESDQRKREHLRRIEQENLHQESLYELLRRALVKRPDLPQAFDT